MKLNKFGLVVKQQWEKSLKRFRHLELGAFVVMPNHVHEVIYLIEGRDTAKPLTNHDGESSRRVSTEKFGKPVVGSIPTIVRSYKSAVSYRINLMRNTNDIPVWQRNYYEHVVRNEKELELITK